MAHGEGIARRSWTRKELLVAFNLYCQLPFGKLHSGNPEIIQCAGLLGRTPSALAMKLTNIASLDPVITSTGRRGLPGASAADREMWDEMQSDWDRFIAEAKDAMQALGISEEPDEAQDSEANAEDFSGINRTVLSTVRIGQNFFRRSVLSAYSYQCCITGLAVPKLLIASHIIPWRVDEKNRLNPSNGLCLTMLHDKAFDAGIITITDELTVRVSRKYVGKADEFFLSTLFHYDGKPISTPDKFSPSREFLAYHRQHVFDS